VICFPLMEPTIKSTIDPAVLEQFKQAQAERNALETEKQDLDAIWEYINETAQTRAHNAEMKAKIAAFLKGQKQ